MSTLTMALAAALLAGNAPEKVLGEMVQESGPTFQIRQYPEEGQPRKRGDAIRVRLDIDRLRAHHLSTKDVMNAMGWSGIVDPRRRPEPPPGVVYHPRLLSPEKYEKAIVKVTADGEVVHLKDVAKVDWDLVIGATFRGR